MTERDNILAEVGSLAQLQEARVADKEHFKHIEAELQAQCSALMQERDELRGEVAELQAQLPGLRQSAAMLDILNLEHETLMQRSANDKDKMRKAALRHMVVNAGKGVAGRSIARWKLALREARRQDS